MFKPAFPRSVSIGVFCATLLLLAQTVFGFEWKTPPDKITLLAVNAHPDDEGIFFGGALPYYSGVLQVPTMLLSMTSGDWNTNNLLIRENELRNAVWTYGLRYEPIFGRFRDVPSQKMTGNPYTNTIDATWDYWADGILQGDGKDVAAGHAKAVNFVAEMIRRYRPEVIITHDFNGEYGHDNHKATALAVSEAYYVAADPNATATNLVGLAPWQVKKLYVHLYKTNQLFHTEWETPRDEFGGKTARQITNNGLDWNVSQGSPDVSTYYLTGENYDGYDSERWGLFASTVGPDTPVTNGVAYGSFFEHLNLTNAVNHAPVFFPNPLRLTSASLNEAYAGQTVARFATDLDKVGGDTLTFSKISGPSWLNVSSNGALSGTPGAGDVGQNLFTVRATDSAGAFDETTLKIAVAGPLVASWDFNAVSNSIAKDSSGQEHNTVLASGATTAIGRDGGALSLDGVNDYAESDNVNVANQLTIAAWIRPLSVTGEHAIVGETIGYTLKTSGASLRFTTPGIKDHTYAAGLSAGLWYHVAVTFEAGATNGCKFYVNGKLCLTTNASAKATTENLTWIGRNQWGQYFSGLLDDVRIYHVALSGTEISAIYSNTPPRFSANPILFSTAFEGTNYVGETLATRASDSDSGDVLTFRKLSGPDWLTISTNGILSGVPASADVGTNNFQMQVADAQNAVAETTLQIVVAYRPTFLLGVAGVQNGKARLMFTGEASQTYRIYGSPDLVNWIPLANIATDAIGRGFWSDPTQRASAYFYRVEP